MCVCEGLFVCVFECKFERGCVLMRLYTTSCCLNKHKEISDITSRNNGIIVSKCFKKFNFSQR